MKRYKYSIHKEPEDFASALRYLKRYQEADVTTDTLNELFLAQDIWNPIPTELDMYFSYRPYLEIMGLEELIDNEFMRRGIYKIYPYHEKYGYYLPLIGSSDIIQIAPPTHSEHGSIELNIIPFNEWETNKEAIEWLNNFIVEEIPETDIEMVPPVDGVNVV